MNLSTDQLHALDQIRNSGDKLFFLTGEAGTGKSTVISHLTKCKMVATTGVAAQLINGTTVHRFLGLRPGYQINPKTFYNRASGYDYVVVDEVSMMGKELFDTFMFGLDYSQWKGKVIFVGDFAQLPPVNDLPAYKHPYWERVKVLSLTTTHRQGASKFLDILRDVRNADYSDRVKNFLRSKLVDEVPKNKVVLASLKAKVNEINLDRIMEITSDGRPTEDFFSKITIQSRYWDTDKAKVDINKNSRSLLAVRLFKGARLMTTRNVSTYVNGTVGTVIDWDKSHILIQEDDGTKHKIKRIETEVIDGSGKPLYTQIQFPVLYAWAITLHKSQGMTLKEAHIDLNNHFAEGQTYVGLSRLSSPEGLTVSGDLQSLKLKSLIRS